MKTPLRKAFRSLPEPAQKTVKGLYRRAIVPYARARLGTAVEPLSYAWGADRGKEIARYYVEQLFLQEFRSDIQGHTLEFFADDYTTRYGGDQVRKKDFLNLTADNPVATIIGDLTKPNDIPSDTFDCIICTHVLHVIYEYDKAVADLHRILKPGGVLLVASPLVSMCDPGWNELWRFTKEGLETMLAKAFKRQNIQMRFYGNSLTAAGQMRGLVAHEFTRKELHSHDERFAVEICARVVK